jgi:hypothetical protein
MAEMPPGIVGELLRPAVDFPAPKHFEILVVHEEDAAGSLSLGIAHRGDVHAFRAAMHCMRTAIAGALGEFGRLDHLDDLWLSRIGLGVDDVNARGTQAGHHEIAPLGVGMRRVGAQAGGAGVPAEMMQLVARIRHGHLFDDRAIAGR